MKPVVSRMDEDPPEVDVLTEIRDLRALHERLDLIEARLDTLEDGS